MGTGKKTSTPELKPVSGRPRGEYRIPGSENTQIPIGFEMLLYRAAQQPAFKQQLLADRGAALRDSAIVLRPSEQALLETVSNEALETMIAHIAPSNPRRRRLMGNVAAAVTSLAAGTAAVATLDGCGDDGDTNGFTTTTTPSGVGGMGITPSGQGGTAGEGGFGGTAGQGGNVGGQGGDVGGQGGDTGGGGAGGAGGAAGSGGA